MKNCIFMIVSRLILLRIKHVSSINCSENQKTRFMFKNFSENRTAYRIMWKNIAQPGRP
jgi:hypothetical protein